MGTTKKVTFKEVLQRLQGVYGILYILPNDSVDGIIKSVDEDGTVTFGVKENMKTNIRFIQSVSIPNEDEDRARQSPLAVAIKQRADLIN